MLGVRNLLLLALAAPSTRPPPTFAFCSSIASVSASSSQPVTETVSHDPNTASPLGYSRSKWVAESLLSRAYEQVPRLRKANALAILRVGQLSGDTSHGIWNATEAWPMMLSSLRATDVLPSLEDESLSWLPVDVAAKGFAQVTASLTHDRAREKDKSEIPVFHILNPSTSPTWTELLTLAHDFEPKIAFEAVEPGLWIHKLEELQTTKPAHSALKLLGMWRAAYGGREAGVDISVADGAASATGNGDREEKNGETNRVQDNIGDDKTRVMFDVKRAQEVSDVLAGVGPLDEVYLAKLWRWIQENVEEWNV